MHPVQGVAIVGKFPAVHDAITDPLLQLIGPEG